ncbi:TPA: amino acid ABC transporter substrate-binding protein [Pseudomonas aeruginosa]|uniref:substrate-binding periplasmic protein n=1 Tax=Pseudomonas aeruginosa TaxID=287 RepID=UPI000B48C790|nr:ABC transporter substrate-binding protein [Pseudomonas aeruginosa]MBG4351733.1 amino acid ABC transporter substrate-binding protein [Pseudomonas aeruginosa]MCU9105306.1 ABC transporter substrate-binding protein [Pseudomonas aeruginosa]MCU9249782.1 ABC transporter substrate-binding protein [Pseudomonas aeruginosa]MCU9304553.1 ABC transporter substrate-binding protein [Pseudomonas aeruginosa]MCU9510338.1 ABC transporter substrate-binding protein [Pseudomonas aeruginosa]
MTDNITQANVLRVICADLPAPPLFWKDDNGYRHGYESDLARLLASTLSLSTTFAYQNWADFYPALQEDKGDFILCGQGISELRKTLADFTEPYAVFDEAVMILRGSNLRTPGDLVGKKVGAIASSLNMALAETFTGCITVPFGGDSDDVMGDMVKALRAGEIDAFVDDDVALVPLAEEADLEIGFTVATQNKWGIAIKKGNETWLAEVNEALAIIKTNGALEQLWRKWMPTLNYPFV